MTNTDKVLAAIRKLPYARQHEILAILKVAIKTDNRHMFHAVVVSLR